FEACGATLTLEEWSDTIGRANSADPADLLAERTGAPLDEARRAARKARRDELLAAEAVLPGVHAWLDDAARLGLPVGVASSSEVDWVAGHLERLGLADRFTCLSCFDGRLQGKPAPDLYLTACEALGVAPGDALAVEDSGNGVAAAKAAGLRCVAVPHDLTRDHDLSPADIVVPSLADLPLEEAMARLWPGG
ncbi:MAG TPA: HAD-IA family hydrolase, partial [Acidimicrobiales bacterium]|nr:HAD-IA family hydrolase [Acidimicrobiales bacterium]